MRFGIIQFPGSNCDRDCHHVLTHVLKQNVRFVWHGESEVADVDCIILPGGFAYGDYLRTGAVAALSPVMEWVRSFAARGGRVLGICNGFQILLEAGLLEGAMLHNRSLRFICRDVYVRVETSRTPFTRHLVEKQVLKLPIAHAEGNYHAPADMLKRIEDEHRVVFRYCNASGQREAASNPNGSLNDIAGICNKDRNVVGLMPHPERASEGLLANQDGRRILASVLEELA